MHSSSWYANPGDVFPATCRMWLIRLAALSWRDRPDFALALLSTGSFAPIVKWSTHPHGLFALLALDPCLIYDTCFVRRRNGGRQRNQPIRHTSCSTCMGTDLSFKYCSYVIFISNTDEIVKKYCSYMSLSLPANFPLRFCKHQYMCKKYGNILLFIYYMGIWFSTGIYRLTLVIKHWNKIIVI